jgi:transposase
MNPLLPQRLVPDAVWAEIKPLIPRAPTRPQGGGKARVDDRLVLVAIVFIVTSDMAWRTLPKSFGVTVPTVYRRFQEWTTLKVWSNLLIQTTDTDDPADTDRQWARTIANAATDRANTETP